MIDVLLISFTCTLTSNSSNTKGS